ncbi:MAG: sigma-70 family RNA polymerase sigma factor [Lachnospiraceae bacterium]|nr:sigma-70 family RNA polymerase sigma factor [Lachnospiraceae bacterium]
MDEFQARRLVNTYADMILRISYQYLKQTYDAEDICQTVFLKYITNNMTFDSIEHEKAWIIRTAISYPR